MIRTHPLLVSFSGIDGAGKSTQILRLRGTLGAKGLHVQIVNFWNDVVALRNIREGAGNQVFKGDQGVGAPEAPITRRDKNVRSPLLTFCRMGLYTLDVLSLNLSIRRITRQQKNSQPDIVIFDRYIYDELANFASTTIFCRIYLRLLLRYAVRPHLAMVLDADPSAAFQRKPEYPLAFLHENRCAYLDLAILAKLQVIPVGTVDEVESDIKAAFIRKATP